LVGDRKIVPAQDGRDISTSIDRTVQFLISSKLKSAIEKYGASSGSILVMDPSNGQIIAMTSFPGYNPNKYSEFSTEIYKNPSVSDTYEPGSTFKTLIMSAGLDAGVIKPDTECDICSGPIKISEYSIKTWNDKYFPNTNMIDVIAHSDNTGMVFVGRKLGAKKMLEYLDKFGIGSPTGIDLEEETYLPLRKLSEWQEVDLATATFGQGIAVTPIQILRAVGSIANRGVMTVPKIKRSDDIGKTTRVISEKAALEMTTIMINSVEKGDAKWARPIGFDIAGKTGTAQISIGGHYDKTKTIASFVGFAPAEKPKFVMLVLLTEPKTSQWGSETAAPLWFDISKELFRYYRIPTK
jgi:cell division protein FtsI (penicillin-binding protein 3)/stage V sporulation protein D (sporulation-specific penicillin-binding protein)